MEPKRQIVGTASGLVGLSRSSSEVHGLDAEKISKIFYNAGFVCEPRGKMRGISGGTHEFDFVGYSPDNRERIILESLLSESGSEESMEISVVKLRLRTYDCSPDVCMIVAKSVRPDLREMLKLYRIMLIDLDSGKDPYREIESLLRLHNEL